MHSFETGCTFVRVHDAIKLVRNFIYCDFSIKSSPNIIPGDFTSSVISSVIYECTKKIEKFTSEVG